MKHGLEGMTDQRKIKYNRKQCTMYHISLLYLELGGVQMTRMGHIEVSLTSQLVVAALSQGSNLGHIRGRQLERGQQRGQLVVRHVPVRKRSKSECK